MLILFNEEEFSYGWWWLSSISMRDAYNSSSSSSSCILHYFMIKHFLCICIHTHTHILLNTLYHIELHFDQLVAIQFEWKRYTITQTFLK